MRKTGGRDYLALIGFIGLGVVLGRVQTSFRSRGAVDPVSRVVQAAIRPSSSAFHSAAIGCSEFSQAVVGGRSLQVENEALRARVASAESYQETVDRLEREIDELRRLGKWSEDPGREKTPGTVIGFFPNEGRLTLDVGSDRGIRRGMAVATFEGLVGRVETVDRRTCQVVLITSLSSESRISALVQSPSHRPAAGLLRGTGGELLSLELSQTDLGADAGDLVVTSGFSDQIPRGLVIGRIRQIKNDAEFGRRTALVEPMVKIGEIHEVLVIK